jgi:hypothetical protein
MLVTHLTFLTDNIEMLLEFLYSFQHFYLVYVLCLQRMLHTLTLALLTWSKDSTTNNIVTYYVTCLKSIIRV